MQIKHVDTSTCAMLVPIFREMNHYYSRDVDASDEQIADYLHNRVFSPVSSIKVVAAFDGDTVLGFATYVFLFPAPKLAGQMYMKELFVANAARGQGVGPALMKFLGQISLDHGCERLDWTAETTNPSAGEFYHSLGAKMLEEKRYYRFEGEALKRFIAD